MFKQMDKKVFNNLCKKIEYEPLLGHNANRSVATICCAQKQLDSMHLKLSN